MGNAGGFSSVGHTTDAGHGDANTSEYDAGEQQHGHQEYGGNSKLSEKQLQQMAGNFGVSKTEIQVLWQRFCVLEPGHEGVLDRSVFQRSPYGEDIFCRQIWRRFSGSEGEPDKISFQSFARSMIWWQKAPVNHKLQLLFSWMKDVDGITPQTLTNILKHIFSEYEEYELKQMAEKMMRTINPSSDPPLVKQDDFQQWMSQLPEEELRDALEFKILHIHAGMHT